MLGHQEVIGVLVTSSGGEDDFTAGEVKTASDLSVYCVPALERYIAIESELDLLDKASVVEPDVPLPLNESLRGWLNILCGRFRIHRSADIVVLIPFDNRNGTMRLDMVAASPSDAEVRPFDPTPSDQGVLKRILDAGEFEWHRDERAVEFGAESFVIRNGIESFFAITVTAPAEGQGQSTASTSPLGVLFVDYKTAKRGSSQPGSSLRKPGFSEFEKQWIRYYARIAGQYLNVHMKTAQTHGIDQAVLKVYRSITPDADLNKILKTVFETGMELVGATAGVLAIPSNTDNDLSILCHRNLDPTKVERPIRFGEGVTGLCGQRRSAVVVDDSEHPPEDVKRLPWVPGSKSEIAVPLLWRDDVETLIGVLDMENQHARNAFGPNEQRALNELANASVLAIQLIQSMRQLKALREIGDKIQHKVAKEDVYRIVLEETARFVGAYAASARAIDPTQKYLEPVHRVGPGGQSKDSPIPVGQGVVGYAFEHRRVVAITDVQEQDDLGVRYPGMVYLREREATRCELAVPLFWRGDAIGVLNFEHTQPGVLSRFTSLVKALADHAAFSIYNIRTLDRQRLLSYDESIECISAFARTVRHNLEPLFRRIQKFANDRSPSQNALELVAEMGRVAEEGLRQAEELVKMAPHLGQPAMPIKPVYVLRRVIESFHREKVQVDFVPKCSDHVVVEGYEDVLAFCFRQVLQNSCQHDATRVDVIARTCPSPSGSGEDLEIELRDNGSGVPQAYVHEIFEPERENLTVVGHGEAMVLCRLYIRHMGGDMRAEEASPRGLAVFVRLPIASME